VKENIAPDLVTLLYPVAELRTLPGNPRRGDVKAVARSYTRFGQTKPIVCRHWEDGNAYVVAGNHQLMAARDELAWDKIAVVWRDDLTADEARALALADNHTAELGGYDDMALGEMLKSVAFDKDLLAATSYSDKDLEKLLGEVTKEKPPIPYVEKWELVVECKDEDDQEQLFERLTAEGYAVKVLQL